MSSYRFVMCTSIRLKTFNSISYVLSFLYNVPSYCGYVRDKHFCHSIYLLIQSFLKVTEACVPPKRRCESRKRKAGMQGPQAQPGARQGELWVSLKGHQATVPLLCTSGSHGANLSKRMRTLRLFQLKSKTEPSIT